MVITVRVSIFPEDFRDFVVLNILIDKLLIHSIITFMKKYLLSSFFIFSIIGTVMSQQLGQQSLAQLQESPAGSNILHFLKAINNKTEFAETDVKELFATSLIDKHGTQGLLAVFDDIKQNDGQIELYEADRVATFEYELKAKGLKHQKWLDIGITLDEQPPYKVNGIKGIEITGLAPKTKTPIFSPTQVVKYEKPQPNVTKDKLDEMDKWLTELTVKNEFSGVVLIAKDFEPIFHKAYGYASKRYKVPNELDTKFRLASVNKIITATAALQLVEKGKLSLDDKLHQYVTGFKDKRTKDITIRHLLTHQSGWGAYWDNEHFLSNRRQLRTVEDYMKFIKDIPLDFAPGTKQQYSNTAYNVLGAVIEAASGMDYYEYVQQNIYQLAGMTNSGSLQLDHIAEGLATGYTNYDYKMEKSGKDYSFENTLFSAARGVPAGSGCSTTGDLLRFLKAVAQHEIVNQQSEEFLRSDIGKSAEPGDFIFHNGGGPGQNAWVQADVGSGYSIVVLSNYDPPTSSKVVNWMGKNLKLAVFGI